MVKEKDVIELDLILKDANTKEMLDTTFPNIAKENNLNIKSEYKPLTFIVGTGELLKNVEKNIVDLEINKSKTFTLKKAEAFGQRDDKLVTILPLTDFKKEKINPMPGMYVNISERSARIVSVSGGRVKVDFNPIFAGRDLEYTITINKIFSKDEEKIQPILDKAFSFMPKEQIEYVYDEKLKQVDVQLPLGVPKELDYFKQLFAKMVLDSTSLDLVKFSQNFTRKDNNK
ncbi:FKBP-type peptidyl-prolyl cis-trans isomerase [archaeon]|nr:FKBP-type peptidyl-prolyl cis-trans isomerase [archaeon]MDD2477939.1 FKBP-type peptidyl-prolyl cis-trans isomerase [Candidatus ainarchaeum sp.]MDD3084835.1 FKBP-type peptidyl-prolyl cis-trans isomerase [Candidatus ainarchaeum sp.]MDD4221243.1 FKBP-type peptidyl-prolyl cis-trans isomerase [Candidatus ainarchaeum sp.]MDD4662750.1 FKBP-type peptidyl-prolyl cis-trans isomerase [Candidatus ainarchaeum sp.]